MGKIGQKRNKNRQKTVKKINKAHKKKKKKKSESLGQKCKHAPKIIPQNIPK
jgi:hypothetical protein